MIARPNGAQLIGQARPQHTESTNTDYVDDIYDALIEGKTCDRGSVQRG